MSPILIFSFIVLQQASGVIACEGPPVVANATAIVNEDSQPLKTAVYTCDEENGYTLVGNDTIFCVEASGFTLWSSVNFACQRIQCTESPRFLANSTVDFTYTTIQARNETTYGYCYYYPGGRQRCYRTRYSSQTHNRIVYYGGSVNLTCESGYKFADKSQKKEIMCGIDGNWIYPNETCQTADCGTIPDSPSTACNYSSTKYPSSANCSCLTGYERRGSYIATSRYTISCLSSGEWSSPWRSCEKVRCPIFQVSNAEVVDELPYGNRYLDNVTMRCRLGYKMKTPNTAQCQANKTWSIEPRCERVDCGEPPQLLNGFLSMYELYERSVNISTKFGSLLSYKCNRGYAPYGNPNVTCMFNATWSTLPTCTGLRCGEPPQIENGNRRVGGHYFNATTTYECDMGYTLSGDSTIYCQFDQHWGAPPECHVISCGRPPTLNHGSIKILDGFNFGNIIEYYCASGFTLSGVGFATCHDNGNWGATPTCQPDDIRYQTITHYSPFSTISPSQRSTRRTTKLTTPTAVPPQVSTGIKLATNNPSSTRPETKPGEPAMVGSAVGARSQKSTASQTSSTNIFLMVMSSVLSVCVVLLLGLISYWRFRRIWARRVRNSSEGREALYTSEGETMTVYSFLSKESGLAE